METESHLSEFLELDISYDRVSHMKRLGNYLIDVIGFYVLVILLAIFVVFAFPAVMNDFINKDSGFSILENLFYLLLYGLYMGAQETIFKGRSLGKFITGTRAVNFDGTTITGKTAFLRGLSRAVPFAVFSALSSPSNPWHDKWTNTLVVDNVKSYEL